MKRAVFFDLYGTLIDIVTDEYDSGVYFVLSRYLSYQLIKIPPEKLRASYFEDIQSSLKESNESYPEVDVYQIFFNMMERYGNRGMGIRDILGLLLNIRQSFSGH
jgi:putative hydrolase of the HAD superfamily